MLIQIACAFLGIAPTHPVGALLRAEAVSGGVPVGLVLAVAWHESRWHDSRVSRCGAVGPLQVLPVWFRRPACRDLDGGTIVGRVACGVRLLAAARARCRDWGGALGLYHHGRGCRADGYARQVLADWRRRWGLWDALPPSWGLACADS